jgi:translation initiation factor 2 beta subunit (eIF-2beta)/eIF-5
MKTTNEIEKQLERKADAYLEQKANEIVAIRRDIERFVGIHDNSFIDFIPDYHGYCNAAKADKGNYVSYHASHVMQNKLVDELAENFKEKLVKKYTKELLTKLDIFE